MSEQHSHKPGKLKHVNKPFKSRHATKGSLKNAAKGKTERLVKNSKSNSHSKDSRKNKAKQLQKAKRDALKTEVAAPRVIALISLCSDTDSFASLSCVLKDNDLSPEDSIHYATHQNQLMQFLTPRYGDLLANIDACLAADYVLLCLSSAVEVEHYGENLLRCITSLGVPDSGVRAAVATLPSNETSNTHAHIKASLLSFTTHFFPSVNKIYHLEADLEMTNLLRSFKEGVPKGVVWREERARLLIEDCAQSGSSLSLIGTIRGACLNVNNLVHLPDLGDFQIEKIEAATPYSPMSANQRGKRKANDMDFVMENAETLATTNEEADDLQSVNEQDAEEQLLAEQTWPTEEEMQGFQQALTESHPDARPGTTPRSIKRVPKGTSEYQAAWILDSGSEAPDEEEDGVDEEEADKEMPPPSFLGRTEEEEEEDTDQMMSTLNGADSTIDQNAYQSFKASRASQAKDDADFPDEVETPQEGFAKDRFAKYRGLKSFRTSTWDPFENLPLEYSKLFMFENYKSMSRNLVNRAQVDGIPIGTRVKVYLKNAPEHAVNLLQKARHPATLFALHKHEHKRTVMHFTVQRNTEYEDDVRSKDEAVLLLGPRRFLVNPLFSQHTQRNQGKGTNNVHKFHRFVQQGTAAVASAYLPVTFGSNTPALLLTPTNLDLISSGSLLSSDPTRILAKRVILTGHPYKLHKRTATIRYMFFNTLDIQYFKPIELHTKKGKKGHIKESLGTHGYYKANFDGPIDQMDTVCLNLYKRCYPKWGRLFVSPALEQQMENGDVEMEM